VFDLDAYVERIGLSGCPGLAELHRAHVASIPFENLDPHSGRGTLLEPLPFGPGDSHEQSGWRFRVVQDDLEHVLQTDSEVGWVDVYSFIPQPTPAIDIEVANWFTSAHPSSPFVTGLIVATQRQDGTRTWLSDWSALAVTEQTPAGSTATALTREEIPQTLKERFGLAGFTLDRDGRVVAAGTAGA
jgi:arylamine N-acetyltransferase